MARPRACRSSTVHRIWRAVSLQPQPSEIFKLSTDPLFVERSATSVAFTSTRRIARSCLSSNEESQIQALDRTQPAAADAAGTSRATDP